MIAKKNLPVLPEVIGIGFEELFSSSKRAELWLKQKEEREKYIIALIKSATALQFADPDNEKRFYTVSPGLRGKKYMLGKFDEKGPFGHIDRDKPEDFIREIPTHYVLVDMI